MNSWTEYNIGIIYFAGLSVALIAGILVLLYLRPIRPTIKKLAGKFEILWNHSFKTTLIIAGILGAMSVSFKDCSGKYEKLLESEYETVMKGFEQVSTSIEYLTLVLGLWLVIFIALQLTSNKKNKIVTK